MALRSFIQHPPLMIPHVRLPALTPSLSRRTGRGDRTEPRPRLIPPPPARTPGSGPAWRGRRSRRRGQDSANYVRPRSISPQTMCVPVPFLVIWTAARPALPELPPRLVTLDQQLADFGLHLRVFT